MITCWARLATSLICTWLMCGTDAYTEIQCSQQEGKPQDCVQIYECPILLKQIAKPLTKETTDQLRESICGFDNKIPKVCCPRKEHRNLYLLPRHECGEYDADNNIWGEIADLNEFPWMALLSYKIGNRKKFACAGSLINNKYVLTAAHCINEDLLGVRIGEYNMRQKKDCVNILGQEQCAEDVQDFRIEHWNVHENFIRESSTNDIALIRLRGTVTTRANAKPICLPPISNEMKLNLTNINVTVAGWGIANNTTKSDVLRKVIVPIVSNEKCKTICHHLTAKKLCVGDPERESCNGDTGGPLISLDLLETDIVYVQYGIVSYGTSKSCGCDKHGVYTKVTEYVDWILDNLEP